MGGAVGQGVSLLFQVGTAFTNVLSPLRSRVATLESNGLPNDFMYQMIINKLQVNWSQFATSSRRHRFRRRLVERIGG